MIYFLILVIINIISPLMARVDFHCQSLLTDRQHAQIADFFSGRNVLVSGGCGFIGSHLVEELVHLGSHVTIIDNLSSGSVDNIAGFLDRIILIKDSITNPDVCNRVVANQEIIFHMAAYLSVPGSMKNPTLCHYTNVNGTLNLLDAARIHRVGRFILSSTAAVYGPRNDACREQDVILRPNSPYGITKRIDEICCEEYSRLFNVPCVILRYFNVYGARQNPNAEYAAVIAKFMYQLENNEPITIFGNGLQSRDFVHVKQVVEANLLAAMAPETLVNNQIYNIGTGEQTSVLELADYLRTLYPLYTQGIQFLPERIGDVPHSLSDCTKFRELVSKIWQTK